MRKYKIKKLDMEMNMAPLIDIVFLLLIFFMVASTLDINEVRAAIQLPQVDMETSIEKDVVNLYLDKTGMIYAGNENISWDMLQDYLKEKHTKFSEGIEVYADKEVDFEYIARLMAAANKEKIKQIIFRLEYDQSKKASLPN